MSRRIVVSSTAVRTPAEWMRRRADARPPRRLEVELPASWWRPAGVAVIAAGMAVALAVLLTAAGCRTEPESPSRARAALEAAGYTRIRDKGASVVGCSSEDSRLTSRVFIATSPGGRDGTVRVCCPLIGGCVVRHGGWL